MLQLLSEYQSDCSRVPALSLSLSLSPVTFTLFVLHTHAAALALPMTSSCMVLYGSVWLVA